MKTKAAFKDYSDHFPPGISPEIDEYATEVVFEFSRYIFIERRGRKRYGYCTHCHSEFPTNKPIRVVEPKPAEPYGCSLGYQFAIERTKREKLPATMICPACGSVCTLKAAGRSRKYLRDKVYFVYYEKSEKNPQAIVARGVYATRDYTGDYRNVRTEYRLKTLYVFEMGKATMFRSSYLYFPRNEAEYERFHIWETCSSVYSFYQDMWGWEDNEPRYQCRTGTEIIRTACSVASIREAVKDTPFRYSTWEQYAGNTDMTKFFDLYSRYPSIEYLTKLGFGNLVAEKLHGHATYRTINWRGKNPLKVTGLSKQEIKTIRELKIKVTFSFLDLLRQFKREGTNLTIPEIMELYNAGYYDRGYHQEIFRAMLHHKPIRQAHGYLKRQAAKIEGATPSGQLITWRDYIRDCERLGLDMTKENILFPKNLERAHQNTIKQIKIKADKELDKQIRARAKQVKQYQFDFESLFIRPATSSQDLINEGKSLHHCVGNYAYRFARGEICILLIRKKSDPDTPYFTLELKGSEIIQCRGQNNCNPNKTVATFIQAFTDAKLTKKNRVRIRVPA